MAVNQWTINNLYVILCAVTLELHVFTTRRNQGRSGQHAVVVAGLLDADLTQGIQPLRKRRGKLFRHMLHDHDSGGRTGQGT